MEANNNKKTVGNEDVSLAWKKQDPFFIDYYEHRKRALEAKKKILLGERQEFLLEISSFLDYTVDYISDYESKLEEIEVLFADYKNMDNKEFRDKTNILWKGISQDHVKYEILPKPEIEEDEELRSYWQTENHKALKELKKVMVDIYKTS